MYLKIISQSTPPLCSIFYPQLGVSQHVAAPSFLPNLPQIVAHTLQKAFFKHSLGCIKKNIFAIRTPYFVVYIPEFGCHSSLRQPHPHPGQSPTNCDVHLAESFFNMLWKYRKNRKSIKHNKLLITKTKNFRELYYTISKLFILL